MSRASTYARELRSVRETGPQPFAAVIGDEHPAAVVDDEGNLILMPRLTRLAPSDVRRFIAWLHSAFDEEEPHVVA